MLKLLDLVYKRRYSIYTANNKEVYKVSDNLTQRLTPKSGFILKNVLLVTEKKKGRNKIIDSALSKEYPLFATMWDQQQKELSK
jgi:hypothetical protein